MILGNEVRRTSISMERSGERIRIGENRELVR
jgi:hypothetical protein